MKSSNEQALREVIGELLNTYRLQQGLHKSQLKNNWAELMGPALAKRAKVISLKDGKLMIKTDSSVLRSELSLAKSKIAERLNEGLGQEVIKEVIVI